MKICIAGAGAIGGFLAAKLGAAGHEVSVLARGAQLAAIAADGLRLIDRDAAELAHTHPKCADDPLVLGPQDCVILAVKAHSLADLVPRLAPLIGPDTPVVTAMNGIPWWFCTGVGGALEGHRLKSVDPEGLLAASLELDRLIGCVLHIGCDVPKPGIVRHMNGGEFVFGEPRGSLSGRVEALCRTMDEAGLTSRAHQRIQDAYWHKLLGNLAMNPIGALTGATLDKIVASPHTRALCEAIMGEAMKVGDRLGLDNGSTIDERIELGGSLGAFKSSMLQDMEKGRPMEIDAIISVVTEMAAIAGVETPHIDAVLALISLRAVTRDAAKEARK